MLKEKTTYVWLPLVAGLIVPPISNLIGKMTTGQTLGNAFLAAWQSFLASPPGSVTEMMWAFLPFGVLSIFIGLKKKKWKLEPLVYVCVTGLLALLVVYLLASVEYERLMDRKMWTAGSISFAFLPLKALFWMSVAMTIGWILARNSKRPKSW